ncbi:hypothetical protein CO173_00315 [Candidatus Uhrbacteria bacterium CG_4_9_14_3_um_filter_41_35]|uniref:Uncharacterized protein n=1 Tax=Candidatus Uhrbacteria bacterium CG_4_9_14_3_um_filter_41_35 TaxID=1975034 RepID=A0A2M7XGV3_9BACT|nr:MAG: hypothetical protein COV92_00470 [Candidatus Uhrbacteria bacterium CG11_big_fil_rev_8_21_14_0_20_41_9]PJA47093.1 MAG: hypothetical protein CO173_00315 [Candidatus Uhrbacteria bacterium CG_4_9_14_3_um_filter_41_35]
MEIAQNLKDNLEDLISKSGHDDTVLVLRNRTVYVFCGEGAETRALTTFKSKQGTELYFFGPYKVGSQWYFFT